MDYRSELLAARAPEQYRVLWNDQYWNIAPPQYGGDLREMTIEVRSYIEPE